MTHFLLLQVRNADDPMRQQEIGCFAKALGVENAAIEIHDLLSGVPTNEELQQADIVLLGGSGDYSVAEGGPWLPAALDAMRHLVEISKPTFASCWGFQAMAKALGGEVVTDMERAELGSIEVQLTEAGREDILFGNLPQQFLAPMGHQDCVTRLPEGVTLLASSNKVENQAFRIDGKPIYCTQFHPELNRNEFLQRVEAYPQYAQQISGLPLKEFMDSCVETKETDALLQKFVEIVCTKSAQG